MNLLLRPHGAPAGTIIPASIVPTVSFGTAIVAQQALFPQSIPPGSVSANVNFGLPIVIAGRNVPRRKRRPTADEWFGRVPRHEDGRLVPR